MCIRDSTSVVELPKKWANFQVVELPTPRPWSRLVDRLRYHATSKVHQIAAHYDSDARPAAVAAPVQPTSQGEQSEPAAQGELLQLRKKPGKNLKLKAKETRCKKIRLEQIRLANQRYCEKLRREAARDAFMGAVDGGCSAARE